MELIYDNLVYSLQSAGGISTYWSELSARLLRDKCDVRFIEKRNSSIVRNAFSIGLERIIPDSTFPNLINRFLPLKLKEIHQEFLFHSSYNRITSNPKAIQITTIHDFVHERFYHGPRKFLHSYQKKKAIDGAQAIICVSENTKRDLIYFNQNLDERKVKVIYNGVSEDFHVVETQKEEKRPFLLFVGSRQPYKNFDFVIDLLKEIPEFDLVIVGGSYNKTEEALLSNSIPGRFRLFWGINNQDLNFLYNSAYALIYPSSYEGFGIPLLEAMKAGTPFIALNKSSIPEVAGNAGILLDELDMELCKKSVYQIDLIRPDLMKRGFAQAASFSWETCYEHTNELYKNLAQ